ncbi:helix-turn-helix domain-containing protein, partial [Streptomyces sp. NPDC058409]|uniref:helix-turn-helix domain-containing protein n=1 Tax=Streptomyces sp. NPDC058409 TaxID=3346484 RepID=UPI0036661E16
LPDRKRSGRPPSFTRLQVAEVKAMSCQLPAETCAPLSHWSCPELAREAVARANVPAVSDFTMRRWLKADAIKPWQYRSWIFIRDPAFHAKAARLLGLYARGGGIAFTGAERNGESAVTDEAIAGLRQQCESLSR